MHQNHVFCFCIEILCLRCGSTCLVSLHMEGKAWALVSLCHCPCLKASTAHSIVGLFWFSTYHHTYICFHANPEISQRYFLTLSGPLRQMQGPMLAIASGSTYPRTTWPSDGIDWTDEHKEDTSKRAARPLNLKFQGPLRQGLSQGILSQVEGPLCPNCTNDTCNPCKVRDVIRIHLEIFVSIQYYSYSIPVLQ